MPMKPRDVISSVIFYTILVALTFGLLRVGTQYGCGKVPQEFTRMQPRLERGANLVVNKYACDPAGLEYGDIIMYRRPQWKRASYSYEFARLLGKPGDVVRLAGNKLYRQERREGKLEPEHQVDERYLDLRHRPVDFSALVVPRNTVFVLFDDRSHREPLRDFLVPVRAIHGRVVR
ncbi:MAG: signal peptidase I [Planctomycetes bacterium]|nr:signal peptidase I [Planctomycetota bacterium]